MAKLAEFIVVGVSKLQDRIDGEWVDIPEMMKVEFKRELNLNDRKYESFEVRLPLSMSRYVPFGRKVLLLVDEADNF